MNDASNPQLNTGMNQEAFGDSFSTSLHYHNGADAPLIPFTNLANSTSYIGYNKVVLHPSDILALDSTPIIILPKPLPNLPSAKIVTIVLGITAYLNFNTTAYTGTHNLEFRYTDASGAKVTADMAAAFLNSASSAYNYAPPVTATFTPVSNTPITVSVPVANPATGDSSITFITHYRLISSF